MDNTHNVPYGGLRKSAGISLAALLLFSAVATVLVYSPINAQAQTSAIQVSADRFFGNSFLQVIITDNTKNSDSAAVETTAVTVRIRDNTGAERTSDTIAAREIGTNSGQFEFFATTSQDDPFAPRSGTAAQAPVFRFNNPVPTTNSGGNDVLKDTTIKPANNWRVEIEYPGQPVRTVNFQTTAAQFNIDRTTLGEDGTAIFIITDQDANIDPTRANIIEGTSNAGGTAIILGTAPNNQLVTGSFAPSTLFTFVETGQNTGVFELQANLAALNIAAPLTSATTQQYAARNYDVYQTTATVGPPAQAAQTSTALFVTTQTTTTTTRTLIFQNNDGILSGIPGVTFAGGLPITVTDSDLNLNTRSEDSVTSGTGPNLGVQVAVDGAAGFDTELVNLAETGDNTGIFLADFNNGTLPVRFINTGAGTPNNGILELRPGDLTGNAEVTIQYYDPHTATGTTNTLISSLRVPILLSTGQLAAAATTVTSTGSTTLTLTDADLNTNSEGVDSYTVNVPAAATINGRFDFAGFGNIAQLEIRLKGSTSYTPASAQTIVFIETGPNTGVFKATIDMQKLATNFNDGDQVQVRYRDSMVTPVAESTATITIGKPSSAVSVDRTTVPLPLGTTPAAVIGSGATAGADVAGTADQAKFRLTITAPSANTDAGVQQTILFTDPLLAFSLVDSSNAALTIGTAGGNNVMVSGFPLTETGPNTGIFSNLITLTRDTGTTTQLNNAKLTITYDGNTATVTLRPSDLVITTDKTIVRNGDTLVVTITDSDRNLDPEAVDEVFFRISTQSDVIATNGILSTTAKETGPNTGVFTKTVNVGTDIRLTEAGANISQATELKIAATDRITTGAVSVTRDLTIRAGSISGTIEVTPEMVGPGSKLTILIHDNDLNMNPAGVDTIGTGTEFLTITTDRTNFPSTVAAGKETGPNTGIFETTVQLRPLPTTAGYVLGSAIGGTTDITNFDVVPGDLVSVRYVDAKNSSSSKVTASKVVQVISQDPTMATDKDAYSAGEAITLSITDLDANVDGSTIDSLRVRVTSTSDPVGLDVTGLETGPNTGIFTFSVPTTTTVSSGSVTVTVGDNVTFKYTDTYPADYADRRRLVADPSKDFLLNVAIGATASPTSTTPSTPALTDLSGNPRTNVTTGDQVIVSVDIQNNEPSNRPYVAMIEVRDSDGFTVQIVLVGGTLSPGGSGNASASWIPMDPGEYTLRTFLVSSVANPSILSPIAESTVTVS